MHSMLARGLAVAALGAPALAWAWGADGHMAIGAIADARLAGTPTAAKVQALLRPGETLEMVAVWADCAKGVRVDDGRLVYHANDTRFPECAEAKTQWKAAEFERFVTANWTQCGLPHGREYCHQQYHYTDVALQRDRYQAGFAGTADRDVVHAINACIAMLQGRPVPAPFVFADAREALMLLAHYVGDIHQPLHVGAIYLENNKTAGTLVKAVDPDAVYDAASDTGGGNLVTDQGANLHSEWDAIPPDWAVGKPGWPPLLVAAGNVPASAGEVQTWSTQWATETLAQAKLALDGPAYKWTGTPKASAWDVSIADPQQYKANAEQIKAQQLARAGARLAGLLQRVLGP